MHNYLFRQGLTFAVIFIFVGTVFVPSIKGDISHLNDSSNAVDIENVYQINQGERWALLIDIANEFSKAPKSMKTVLCRNGWQEDHIKIVTGDNIKAKDIINSISWLATHSSSDDTVLIYQAAHGYYNRFYLQDGQYMYYWRLNLEINKIKAQGMAIVIMSCYGGSAIPFLKKNNRVIITPCKWNEVASGFHHLFNIALQGFSDYEGNNDEFVSAEELFNYTLEDEVGGDNPQIQDDYPGELILTSVNPTFVDKENIDVYHNHPYNSSWFVDEENPLAQSFKPLGDKITKVKLLLDHIYTTDSLVVSIRKNLDGNDLTSKIIPADTFSDCDQWVCRFFEVDLPDIVVNPNDTYYIVCRSNSQDSYYLGVDNRMRDGYYDGKFYLYFGSGGWKPSHNYDLIFIVYGENINNILPNNPDKPSGPTKIDPGNNFNYSTRTTDSNGNQVYYKWDWGDGNFSYWLGPFDSGEEVTVSHIWKEKGTYIIRVKARDVHGAPSTWSEPLSVTTSKNRAINTPLIQFIQSHLNLFPILQTFL